MNIDFTKSDLPSVQNPKPAPVIKTDNPLTNDILSLYNQPKEEAKGKSSILIFS